MLILSIDHSFNRTGYAVLNNKKLISTGSFEVGRMTYESINEFRIKIEELIDKYNPHLIVTEKPAHMRNAEIARMLSGLHTTIIIASIRRSIPYSIVNPKNMKKHITGKGNADKSDVCKCLVENYNYDEDMLCKKTYYKNKDGIKKIDYDESDAVGNALYVMEVEQ